MARPAALPEEKEPQKPREGGLRFELWGLVLLALGALSLVSLFLPGGAGAVGRVLGRALRAFMGGASVLLGLLLAGVGVAMVVRRRHLMSLSRVIGLCLAVVVAAALLHLRVAPGLELEAGWAGAYGGLVGGGLAWLVRRGFGEVGGVLVLAVAVAVVLVLATGLPLATVARGVGRGAAWLSRLPFRRRGRARRARRLAPEAGAMAPGAAAAGELAGAVEEPVAAGALAGWPAPAGTGRGPTGPLTARPGVGPAPGTSAAGAGWPASGRPPLPANLTRTGFEQLALDSRLLYQRPPLGILQSRPAARPPAARRDAADKARLLEEILDSFGVKARVTAISRGPVVTRFELQPAPGVRVSRIVGLANDIALGLAAPDVRIEAPIPGKAAVGVEVPNQEIAVVWLREVLESQEWGSHASPLAVVLGKDIAGRPVVGDLQQMVHLLIAGAPGSGKSVCLNSIIAGLLFKATPSQVRLLLIDPKVVELSNYNGIPHLLAPVVTEPRQAASCLKWLVHEMERRYELFAWAGAKDIGRFNRLFEEGEGPELGEAPARTSAPAAPLAAAPRAPAAGAPAQATGAPAQATGAPAQPAAGATSEGAGEEAGAAPTPAASTAAAAPLGPLPYLVVVIDELADLMMVSPVEVEDAIHRLSQMARAAGIHLVVATQRPSVDVITGVIKANIPSRIAFAVSSQVDSRTILDMPGAERLLGRGDMLYLPVGSAKPPRVQGAYISDREVDDLVAFVKRQGRPQYLPALGVAAPADGRAEEYRQDPLLGRAARVVVDQGQASVSLLQRKLRVGYARAARLLDELEERGYVGRYDGSRPREVRISREELRRVFGEGE